MFAAMEVVEYFIANVALVDFTIINWSKVVYVSFSCRPYGRVVAGASGLADRSTF